MAVNLAFIHFGRNISVSFSMFSLSKTFVRLLPPCQLYVCVFSNILLSSFYYCGIFSSTKPTSKPITSLPVYHETHYSYKRTYLGRDCHSRYSYTNSKLLSLLQLIISPNYQHLCHPDLFHALSGSSIFALSEETFRTTKSNFIQVSRISRSLTPAARLSPPFFDSRLSL